MKLLHSVPYSQSSLTFYLPKGQYGSIMVLFDLTAQSGKQLTRSQFGNVVLNWNGQDVINSDVEILNLLNNVYGGTSLFTNTSGGAHKLALFLQAGLFFDNKNVYDIGENDRVYIKLDFSQIADTTNIASGNVKIYGKNKVGVMNYLANFISRPIVASGAATLADSFPINNVSQIYFKDPATLLSTIQLTKDSETIIDAEVNALIAYSDFIHQLEATNTTLAIDFTESLDVRESVGNTISYKLVFSGSGTQYMYISYVDWTPGKAIESQATAQNKLAPVISNIKSVNANLESSLKKAQSVGSAVSTDRRFL